MGSETTVVAATEVPYSIYTKREKWFIVGMVAVTGLYSPLPANIFFPAIPVLSDAFHQSVDMINLTVTVYLVMQGVSPMLWGPLSDHYGRRPIFLICLVILLGSCIGLALCPTSAFWLMLLLRCMQAAGCASTIALGAGVIGDISEAEERGGYFGMFNLGPMLAPCIGPAIGGVLAEQLGWRSIFWFLVIMAAVCLAFIILFLPETMRALVGNGSGKVTGLYRAVLPVVGRHASTTNNESDLPKPKSKDSMNPFILFTYPDVIVSLAFTGMVYAVNYTITATVSSSFSEVYPYLSETALGLCYLPTGAGMIVGSTLTGKLLDFEYAKIKAKIAANNDGSQEFPKEYARLRRMPAHLIIFCGSAIAWGWCVDRGVSVAVPLVLQVVLGWTSIAILNTTMTLMIDILQTRSSGATACTNLVRCSLAAVLVSLIDQMKEALGVGWSYVLLSGLCAICLPLMYVEIKFGPRWRAKRDAQE